MNKTEEAIKLYTEGKISMGKAAELADVSIWKFLDIMKEKKISIKYDLEDLKKEDSIKEDVEWGLGNK